MNTNLLFTPSGVFDLLNQIDELKDYDIQLAEVGDSVVLQVGESIYNIAGDVYEVQAPGASVAAINTYDEEVSDGLENAEVADVESSTSVTAGILKEAAKTLLIGGLVRLTSKLLRR